MVWRHVIFSCSKLTNFFWNKTLTSCGFSNHFQYKWLHQPQLVKKKLHYLPSIITFSFRKIEIFTGASGNDDSRWIFLNTYLEKKNSVFTRLLSNLNLAHKILFETYFNLSHKWFTYGAGTIIICCYSLNIWWFHVSHFSVC